MKIFSIEEVITIVWQLREKHPLQDVEKLQVVMHEVYEQLFELHMRQRVIGMTGVTHVYGMKIIWSSDIAPDNIIVGVSSKL